MPSLAQDKQGYVGKPQPALSQLTWDRKHLAGPETALPMLESCSLSPGKQTLFVLFFNLTQDHS